MTNREFQNIMKNNSDKTLGKLSGTASLTKRDKDRIFSRSMEKLLEKERDSQNSAPAPHTLLPEDMTMEIYSKVGEQAEEEIAEVPRISRSFGSIVAIAASLVIAVWGGGMLLLHSNKDINTDLSSGSRYSSHAETAASSEHGAANNTIGYDLESTDESQETQTESEIDVDSESEESGFISEDSSKEIEERIPEVTVDESSSQAEPSPDDQDTSSDDSSEAPSSDDSSEAPSSDTDSQAVDMDDLKLQMNDSIDALNTMLYIAKGGYADLTVWYDADFNVTDNKDEVMYYAIPEEYKETCENASMMMHSGHFTGGFISSLGLDDISDRFVENDGTLYFIADRFTAYRAEYYRLLDEEIHMEGNDRFFVYVTEGHGVYSLSFVYEPVITVYTSIWKMDSLTFEGSLY